MSSGNKEEAKVMEAVTKVKKSNAFDVIVAAVTEERFHCHMIDVLAIGLFVQMMMEVPSVTKLCKQRILNLIYFAVEYVGDGDDVVSMMLPLLIVVSSLHLLFCPHPRHSNTYIISLLSITHPINQASTMMATRRG
mmetsp:Transcript_26436/g.55133  ORF Transcript_26436/g.55133 Transcript_26436/m.55133 type:complete len:136 (-) Transcript_26436:239-646(-)